MYHNKILPNIAFNNIHLTDTIHPANKYLPSIQTPVSIGRHDQRRGTKASGKMEKFVTKNTKKEKKSSEIEGQCKWWYFYGRNHNVSQRNCNYLHVHNINFFHLEMITTTNCTDCRCYTNSCETNWTPRSLYKNSQRTTTQNTIISHQTIQKSRLIGP